MSVIPEVKCRRCGETFSALRSRCPNCGTRRVTQSGRTPGATPGTVKGTASYERAEANTRWQMIFGLILVVAVILAVIIMVSTSLNGADSTGTTTPRNTPSPSPSEDLSIIIDTPPTPTPTPPPTITDLKIFYHQEERTEFLMHMGEAPVTVTAVAYPITDFTDATYTWTCSDPDYMKITVSDDTKSCTCEILQPKNGGVKLTVSCNGRDQTIPVYLVN